MDMAKIEYDLIIPAAGSGKRIGGEVPKQFIEIKGEVILSYTINAFLESEVPPKQIIISYSKGNEDYLDQLLQKNNYKNIRLVEGGKTRQESVFNALKSIKKSKYVLIHDSVRPFITSTIIKNILGKLSTSKAVIPVVPVKDTIKFVEDNSVIDTPDRAKLFAAQTPQGFEFDTIYNANLKCEDLSRVTDDSSIVEMMGEKVEIVEGNYSNFKITTSDDLEFAKKLI